MFPWVLTKDAKAVEREVLSAYMEMFPKGDSGFVPAVFGWASDYFGGRYRDYQAVDASYHDIEHTMQGTLCMVRLLQGRCLAGVEPALTEHMLQLGILAILLHDSGYLKKREDTEGTGAKYTVTHVSRSADFSAILLGDKGYCYTDIRAVQNMIFCTGINANLAAIPFQSELERVVGYALGTGDLLGQMAAEDYVEKLPILFEEFAEAAKYTEDRKQFILTFNSSAELLHRTPAFWEGFVKPKLENDFGGVYRFLNKPYPAGTNEYVRHVEANIDRLRRSLVAVLV
jgi:hypothetical protein